MNERHSDLLDRARGLASAKVLIERATDELLTDALAIGANVSAVARILGIHRSSFYRRSRVTSSEGGAADEDPPSSLFASSQETSST